MSVTSFGDDCVSFDRTDTAATTDDADVFPLDRRFVGGGEGESTCPVILLSFAHAATLRFDEPGTKAIHIHGRRVTLDADEDIRIDVSVVVE